MKKHRNQGLLWKRKKCEPTTVVVVVVVVVVELVVDVVVVKMRANNYGPRKGLGRIQREGGGEGERECERGCVWERESERE